MYAVVQVRGVVKTRQDIKDTLKMLRLHHINHCVLIPDSPENLGMIRKVKDYVAYGEVDASTVETLLQTRGRVIGDAPLTDEYIKSNSSYGTIGEFAKALASGETKLRDIPGLNPCCAFTPRARDTRPPSVRSLRVERLAIMVRRSILSSIR